MRKHHTDRTDYVDLEYHFRVPASESEEIARQLEAMGGVDVSDSVPWRDLFPEVGEEEEAGTALRGARGKEDLTQQQLAELTGIPQRHISEMENSKRPIGKENAKKLAAALNVSYRIFL
jgi:DNA-binding XRE family transcriptional regulator